MGTNGSHALTVAPDVGNVSTDCVFVKKDGTPLTAQNAVAQGTAPVTGRVPMACVGVTINGVDRTVRLNSHRSAKKRAWPRAKRMLLKATMVQIAGKHALVNASTTSVTTRNLQIFEVCLQWKRSMIGFMRSSR